MSSSPGAGSTFTLYLPQSQVTSLSHAKPAASAGAAPAPSAALAPAVRTAAAVRVEDIADDRDEICPSDVVLLIVEDDPHYARVLLELARRKGFKALVAGSGERALSLAAKYKPTAISLDVFLPDMLGWTVLNQLKRNPDTRHIPVQLLTVEDERQYGLERGAFSFVTKPITTEGLEEALDRLKSFVAARPRRLLVVEDNAAERLSIMELLGSGAEDIEIFTAESGASALALMRERSFDCVVLDLALPDISGFELLAEAQRDASLRETPIVVFTGRDLTVEEEGELRRQAKSIVLKGVRSPERLLDETALFLHRVIADLPPEKQQMIHSLHESDEALRGRKVLVVDDDIRNVFALNSLLERHDMQVINASNGYEAIDLLERTDELSLVLMDVMMPEMDGYETMRRIRTKPQFKLLPIIALTAKAMKGDREKCLEAGASDYVAKPVNSDQLLSLVRMWLRR